MAAKTDPPTWGWLARSLFWFAQTIVAAVALYAFWGIALGDGRADLAMQVTIPLVSTCLLFRQVSGLVGDELRIANDRRNRPANRAQRANR